MCLSYSLPLLPAGLRRTLDFVSLVSHDDVLLLHQSAAPPQHAVGAEGARTLIRRAVVTAVGGVEAGRSGRKAQALGDGMRDLQRAGADALSQAVAGCGAGLPPPGLRFREGKRRLDQRLTTWATRAGAGVAVRRQGEGTG